MSLRFEDLPATAALAEIYNCAILLEDADGNSMTDVESVKVQLEVEAGHSSFQSAVEAWVKGGGLKLEPVVEISCGEGLFELCVTKPAPTASLVIRATLESGELPNVQPAEADLAVPSVGADAATAGPSDEELSDVGELVKRLAAAIQLVSTSDNVDAKVRHYCALLKGRMWNASHNSTKLLDAGLVPVLLELLKSAPASGGATVEAVLEALNVIEALLTNSTGCVIMSCSSCRALIMPDPKVMVLSAGDKGAYHTGCLRCTGEPGGCNESIMAEPFVRAKSNMRPLHVACAAKAGTEVADATPLRCQVLSSVTGSHDDHVAARAFWTVGAPANFEQLATVLKARWLSNEYIAERADRVARHALAANPELMQAQRLYSELKKK
jgi:hypothetical protein